MLPVACLLLILHYCEAVHTCILSAYIAHGSWPPAALQSLAYLLQLALQRVMAKKLSTECMREDVHVHDCFKAVNVVSNVLKLSLEAFACYSVSTQQSDGSSVTISEDWSGMLCICKTDHFGQGLVHGCAM